MIMLEHVQTAVNIFVIVRVRYCYLLRLFSVFMHSKCKISENWLGDRFICKKYSGKDVRLLKVLYLLFSQHVLLVTVIHVFTPVCLYVC